MKNADDKYRPTVVERAIASVDSITTITAEWGPKTILKTTSVSIFHFHPFLFSAVLSEAILDDLWSTSLSLQLKCSQSDCF